jgi:hypothetical protein
VFCEDALSRFMMVASILYGGERGIIPGFLPSTLRVISIKR